VLGAGAQLESGIVDRPNGMPSKTAIMTKKNSPIPAPKNGQFANDIAAAIAVVQTSEHFTGGLK